MSDRQLTSPAEQTAPTAPLSDAEVANAVSNKFLTEVNQTLTTKDTINTGFDNQMAAWDDISNLRGDPQAKVVLDAIAQKITSHDPSLGIVQGTVERGANGEITGFSFDNPQRAQEYQQSLNAYEQQGHTRQEAIDHQQLNPFNQPEITGHMDIAVSDSTAPAQSAPSDSAKSHAANPPENTNGASAAPAHYAPLGTIQIPG